MQQNLHHVKCTTCQRDVTVIGSPHSVKCKCGETIYPNKQYDPTLTIQPMYDGTIASTHRIEDH